MYSYTMGVEVVGSFYVDLQHAQRFLTVRVSLFFDSVSRYRMGNQEAIDGRTGGQSMGRSKERGRSCSLYRGQGERGRRNIGTNFVCNGMGGVIGRKFLTPPINSGDGKVLTL